MKFYVTGRSSNFEAVKKTFQKLKTDGHEVTFEWTSLPMVKPYSENQDKAAQFAVDAIQGVLDADVYVIFTHKDGNGVFTELGAALAMNMNSGKPRIIAIGEKHLDAAMFHAHPAIEWCENIDVFWSKLGL